MAVLKFSWFRNPQAMFVIFRLLLLSPSLIALATGCWW